jgi:Mg2+-importing ATPase
MNILCSDKTGTITEGKVTLKEALNAEGEHAEKVLFFAWLNASMQKGFHNPIDATICAACTFKNDTYKLQSEIPYDFLRKRLTIQVYNPDGNIAITKGALNAVLDICDRVESRSGAIMPLDSQREGILKQYRQLSETGYRTLGVAYKKGTNEQNFARQDETGMIFLGFITLYDPPKKDVQETIGNLNKLGVQLKIITGDNALVAANLAKQVGVDNPVILTGLQMRQMSDGALMQQVLKTNIFAEVEPNQKEKIIIFLKKSGNVVGFMGDGINDAPALHAADVGISVDGAVDVAKQAADIVLLKTDLAVLCKGIISGRKTFANTMKYIFMATSANFGNMFSMAGASLFLSFLPLLPKQILLTNLLTDLPEMTIAADKVDDASITSPHKWDICFIQRFMIVFGLLSSVFDYLTFAVLLYVLKADQKTFQTGWFIESVISATFIVLVVRTKLPFLKSLPGRYLLIATIGVVLLTFALPFTPLAAIFGFVPLTLTYYCWILPIIAAYIICAEITKRYFYKKWNESHKSSR